MMDKVLKLIKYWLKEYYHDSMMTHGAGSDGYIKPNDDIPYELLEAITELANKKCECNFVELETTKVKNITFNIYECEICAKQHVTDSVNNKYSLSEFIYFINSYDSDYAQNSMNDLT